MPENLPKAVMILLWLLIGTIILGYLIMHYGFLVVVGFALIWYGVPVWGYRLYQQRNQPSDNP